MLERPIYQPVLDAANTAPPIETPPAVALPIDASGSAAAVGVRTFLFQMVIAAGALVTVMGLGPDNVVTKWVAFFQRAEAIPVITLIGTITASTWQIIRGLRKHRWLQTVSFFVSNKVAKSPEAPSEAVKTAVRAGMTTETLKSPFPAF